MGIQTKLTAVLAVQPVQDESTVWRVDRNHQQALCEFDAGDVNRVYPRSISLRIDCLLTRLNARQTILNRDRGEGADVFTSVELTRPRVSRRVSQRPRIPFNNGPRRFKKLVSRFIPRHLSKTCVLASSLGMVGLTHVCVGYGKKAEWTCRKLECLLQGQPQTGHIQHRLKYDRRQMVSKRGLRGVHCYYTHLRNDPRFVSMTP